MDESRRCIGLSVRPVWEERTTTKKQYTITVSSNNSSYGYVNVLLLTSMIATIGSIITIIIFIYFNRIFFNLINIKNSQYILGVLFI